MTVYQEDRGGRYYIIDGERRWICAGVIETDPKKPKKVRIPANVVVPPSKTANLLYMFNIHNLRAQWELMPTALSLGILIRELKETNDEKLAELTKLSLPNVKRCKTLLSYSPEFQNLMLDPDPDNRIRANFFIEMQPVLELYLKKLPKKCSAGKSRKQLTNHFLEMYRNRNIPSVIHFRRILEAYDYLHEDKEKRYELVNACKQLASTTERSIRSLFDPLVLEEKDVDNAEHICGDFLKRLRKLNISHITRRAKLRKLLLAIRKYTDELLEDLED